jgi:uridine kinase
MKIKKIYKRDGTPAPFNRQKIVEAITKAAAEVGVKDYDLIQKLVDRVIVIVENNFTEQDPPAVEDMQDIVEEVLIKDGQSEIAKAFILYRQKRREIREKQTKAEIEKIPYRVIWETLIWNLEHSCETIVKLNEHIKVGSFSELIKAAEKKYDDEITEVANLILNQKDKIKLLIIAGPSSSGKSTTADRLGEALAKAGIRFLKFSVDNYFYNVETQLKDKHNDYDYEGPYALEISLINKHLAALVKGKTIDVPFYNFVTGQREQRGEKLKLEPNQIILVDSHFGLYDRLTEAIPGQQKFGLYLETLCQIKDKDDRFVKWTDVRLLRRMIRDVKSRGLEPVKTVGHWHYVRRGEIKNIIPNISHANYILNTALPYELPILKHYLYSYLPAIMSTYQNNPEKIDAFIRAERAYNLLSEVEEWSDMSVVPQKSLLREFIG